LRDDIVKEAKRVYEKNPDKLIEVLDPDEIGSICHFAIQYSSSKYGGRGFNPKEWQWLAKILLEAGDKNSELIIPQITILLGEVDIGFETSDSDKHITKYRGKFIEQRAIDLFGDDFERLMKLLVSKIDISKYNEQEKAFIDAAQQYARQWLDKK
jgi:hypothetical protein